ncbi:MAG TPA: glycosyltransferase family 39 protein [Candidatus Hydrogenedentes bacterium]|nr:glycosyltransferase family 39 protein [Candidatus Hydrogenedentota bacterium]
MNWTAFIYVAVLAAAVGVSFFMGLGQAPLFNKDECAFSEATREMMASGNYLMTYLNGEPRYDKPILIYWCQAASVALFGLNEFALRLPSAIAAAIWVFITFLFTRKFWDAQKAFLAAFFLVTAAQVSMIAKAAIADALLNCFLTIAMFCIYQYYETGHKKHMYISFAMMALGMLTKGPLAIVIPFGASFLFCLLQKDLKRWIKAVFNPVGILIFLAIAAPWFILVVREHGMDYINGFFFEQNVKRFGSSLEHHGGSIFYYIPIVLLGVLPYTTLLLKSFRDVRASFKTPITRYLLIWFGFVFVLVSLAGTKLPHYIIYGYPPLFILMALQVDRIKRDAWLIVPPVLLIAAAFITPRVLPLFVDRAKDPFIAAQLTATMDAFRQMHAGTILVCALLLVMVIGLVPKISRNVRLIVMGLATVVVVNVVGMALIGQVMHQPVKEAGLIAKQHTGPVVIWETKQWESGLVFYMQRFTEKRWPMNGDIIFTQSHILPNLAEADILYEKNGFVLAKIKHIHGT